MAPLPNHGIPWTSRVSHCCNDNVRPCYIIVDHGRTWYTMVCACNGDHGMPWSDNEFLTKAYHGKPWSKVTMVWQWCQLPAMIYHGIPWSNHCQFIADHGLRPWFDHVLTMVYLGLAMIILLGYYCVTSNCIQIYTYIYVIFALHYKCKCFHMHKTCICDLCL